MGRQIDKCVASGAEDKTVRWWQEMTWCCRDRVKGMLGPAWPGRGRDTQKRITRKATLEATSKKKIQISGERKTKELRSIKPQACYAL